MAAAGVIKVHRIKTGWRDRVRAYEVVIDGRTAGRLKNGETLEAVADSGEHSVQAKIGRWWSSPKVGVAVTGAAAAVLYVKARPMGEPLTEMWQAIRHPDSYILIWAEGSRPPDEP